MHVSGTPVNVHGHCTGTCLSFSCLSRIICCSLFCLLEMTSPVRDLGTQVIVESEEEGVLDQLLRETDPEGVSAHRQERSPTPVVDVEEQRVDTERTNKKREDWLKTQTWRGTSDINRKFMQTLGKEMKLEALSFDTKLEFGQVRSIRESHVQDIVQSLIFRPPLTKIRITAWENAVDRRVYVIAGQHILRALVRVKQQREAEGLPLERWNTHVDVDLLRFETPLEDRRTIAGAINATTRLSRSTTITECLKLINIMQTDPNTDMNEKIIRAVEQCGLNAPGSTPVCFCVTCCCGKEHNAACCVVFIM